MSRKDALLLASRGLAVLLTITALADVSFLPEFLNSFIHYNDDAPGSYWKSYYLIRTGFLVVRIVGYSLAARWLFKGGPEVEELLLPGFENDAQG
jgi:hypothetical protein